MTTRIREVRRRRALTLQALADKVGTTPQTIQRLETNNMTVSVDWLLRIAEALELSPADLLEAQHQRRMVRYLGDIDTTGAVIMARGVKADPCISVSVPYVDPVAVTVTSQFGPFVEGTILVAEKLDREEHARADGRDCLVSLVSGGLLFRRILVNGDGTKAYVPYTDQAAVERNLEIDWIAPIVMSVRYTSDHQPQVA